MCKKFLKNETCFAGNLGKWLSNELPDKQKKEVEQMFTLDHGGIVAACNRYMQRTIRAIKRVHVSLDGFDQKSAENFNKLLNCSRLDAHLRDELSRLIYDESYRAQAILVYSAGWDGKFPIPVAYKGKATLDDLMGLHLLHADGDSQCFWFRDAPSALTLFLKGHDLVTDSTILRKRAAYNG